MQIHADERGVRHRHIRHRKLRVRDQGNVEHSRKRNGFRRPLHGFTLIEQLAAAALSVLLALGALAVLHAIGRDRADMAARSDEHVSADALRMIRFDVQNAMRVRSVRGRVVLSGFNSLDPRTLGPTHRPVRVTYVIVGPWLIRRQEALDVPGNRDGWSELVCRGVTGIEIVPTQPPAPTTRPSAELFGPSDGLSMGAAARVILRPASPGGPAADQVIWAR